MKQLLLAVLVLAAWVGLTTVAAWAVPPRDDPNAPPDLSLDEKWLLRVPYNPPQYDRAPSIRTAVATTVAAQPAPSSPRPTRVRPPPAAVSTTPGVEQWRGLLSQYADWDVDLMLAIMRCESGGRPDARNASSGAAGLLQLYPAPPGAFDPATNIALGHQKWVAAGGYSPWVSSRGCWG